MIPLLLLALAQTAPDLDQKAQQAAQAGQTDTAAQLWHQALQLDPQYFPAAFNLGLLYTNTQQWQPATTALANAAKLQPANFNTHYLLGAAHSRLGHSLEAIQAWRTAARLRPDHAGLWQLLVVEYGKERYFQEAAGAARKARQLKPDDVNIALLAIKAFSEAGEADVAAALARETVQRFPDHPRTNFEHAFYLQRSGLLGQSLTYLEKAMKLAPGYEEPFYLYGELLAKQSKPEAALAPFRRAITIRPDYLAARLALARALMQLNQFKEAIAELQQADPKQPQPHLLLSQIYFRLGDEAKAQEEKTLSLKLRRENPSTLEPVQGRTFP